MAVNMYDKLYMSKEDLTKAQELSDAWGMATSQSEKDDIHNALEGIRGKYGYSSGSSGTGYSRTGTPIPQLGNFEDSPLDQYSKKIDRAISAIEDYGTFEYNPDDDEAYQAFLAAANKNAKTVFDNTIAGASVGTGGRPNSWATTIAAQSQGNILLDASAKMADFRNLAYDEWSGDRTFSLQELDALMGLDQAAYGRYTDLYNSEVATYNAAIEQKKTEVEQALERTELTGFVSNEDSITLGVPAGTPSQTAQERAWSVQEYLEKARIDQMYPSKSSKGGDSGDYWSDTKVYNSLKSMFGATNGKLDGTAEEVGAKLFEWYNAGYIDEGQYYEYLSSYGATAPAAAQDDKVDPDPQAVKDAQNTQAKEGRNNEQTKRGLVQYVRSYQSGKLSLSALNKLLRKAGYVYNAKTDSIDPIS